VPAVKAGTSEKIKKLKIFSFMEKKQDKVTRKFRGNNRTMVFNQIFPGGGS
jgi:hypothetical protein